MLFAFLFTMALTQVQSSKPEPAQTVSTPTVSTAPATPSPAVPDAVSSSADTAAIEPEPEPELQTRQVCRYVEVAGQRFPVRRCRTVTIEPEDRR